MNNQDAGLEARCRELLLTLSKRPRVVLEHILAKGSVSTFELGELGYDQPPRAAQDLKEAGVRLLVTFSKHPSSGQRMAVYSLADLDDSADRAGRRPIPKAMRTRVLRQHGNRCAVCGVTHDATGLQIDHRVPFIVAGETEANDATDFQPLCGAHQRSKSWACEHCANRTDRDVDRCRRCYWACPDGEYEHVALREERRADITWTGSEDVATYQCLRDRAQAATMSVADIVREAVAAYLAAE
jgi:hypothetical protein